MFVPNLLLVHVHEVCQLSPIAFVPFYKSLDFLTSLISVNFFFRGNKQGKSFMKNKCG